MEIKVDGKFILDQEMSHEQFIHLLVNTLQSKGIHFAGKTKDIADDEVKIYKK